MTTDETLRSWVREHGVCWRLSPFYALTDRVRVQSGYKLELVARHSKETGGGGKCLECRKLHEELRTIAFFGLPQANRPQRYEFGPLDASFHLRPEGTPAPEVRLTVRVIVREGVFDPRERCERSSAEESEERLRGMGAWSEGESVQAS